ncbi:MAG: hypothetical protein LVR00_01975 [Rhabdochlamydiaceae bacterium]|jgi:SAM-dependent methyltransferase
MRSIGEFFELLYLRCTVAFYNLKEEMRVRKRFYSFKKLDEAILAGPNPYKVPKAFPYGETPLTTLQQIANRWSISSADYFVELGCGRGRGVFFMSYYTGCKAKGVDWVSVFISNAQMAQRMCSNLPVTFVCADITQVDLSSATVIYLYGTCLDDPTIARLSETFKQLPPQVKIITVSYPFPGLTIQDQMEASFPWGKTDVYMSSLS